MSQRKKHAHMSKMIPQSYLVVTLDAPIPPYQSDPTKRGRKCYAAPTFSGSPTPSAEITIRIGYLARAFSGAQKRAEMLRHPCILGGP